MATYTGDANNNSLTGSMLNDTINGMAGADTMNGGLGDDTYYVDNAGDLVQESAIGGLFDKVYSTVSYTLVDSVEQLHLQGTDNLNGTGNGLNNLLVGTAGNNVIDGGEGIDSMQGGAGNDTYYVDNIFDIVQENGFAGYDKVVATAAYTLSGNIEELEIVGFLSEGVAPMGVGDSGANLLIGHDGYNWLAGMAGNDTIYGGNGGDSLWGGLSDDLLYGEDGNDALWGELGNDTLYGGRGDDTYHVDSLLDVVVEQDVELSYTSHDTVSSSVSWTLANLFEDLSLVSPGTTGTGNAGNNLLTGSTGNDTLDGAAGTDTLQGRAGDDFYVVNSALDVVVEIDAEGNDHVSSSVNYTLSGFVEQLTLTGNARNGTGNEIANTLNGNGRDNTLTGAGGDDTLLGLDGIDYLEGGSGNDSLVGGAGIDTMAGGTGDDIFVVNTTADVVIEWLFSGIDEVRSAVSIAELHANVENLVLTGTADLNGTGNLLNNALTGNAGANVLDGGLGIDTMTGAAGNDTYYVDNLLDVVVEATKSGIDTVVASVNYTLGDNLENLQVTGHLLGVGPVGTGNVGANLIQGGEGANWLDGADGNDTIDGGNGADTLAGGVGDDSLLGSAGNDSLVGGSGKDTLVGGAGKDTLVGGTGNDLYVVADARDAVVEAASGGIDTVQASVNHVLAANVENLLLTGTAQIAGGGNGVDNVITGNSSGNLLQGNSGKDVIAGGDGNDRLEGDAGNDTLTGGAGVDAFRFDSALNASTNVDHITDFSVADADRIELDVFTFMELTLGGVDASAFHVGMAAGSEDHRLVYDNVSGNLYYDQDGLGGDAQVLFAVIDNLAALTATQFTVV